MLKQIGKFVTEPLRKDDKSRPLRWRMGMRLNHIHNDLHYKHSKIWNAVVMTARTLICKPFDHHWTKFTAVKYGDFGSSRICKVCRISHGHHRGIDTYHETHRQDGWNKIDKP